MRRTHTCGDLGEKDVGRAVVLQGWVQSRRDHGGVIFIDLRDRYGITQIRFDPKISAKAHKDAEELRREYVIEAEGKVVRRPRGMENEKIKTGKVEVAAMNVKILNTSKTPPFEIDDRVELNEDIRLRYRHLDLRRPKMQRNIKIRHQIAKAVREFLDSEGFLEIETPMLGKSTPEGARDYLVPSRVHPGKFYALPQSPQLFKQLLMIAGFDRYFQIARCFRDEDLRADRQPEFTQIDIEMSFVDEEDIFDVVERLIQRIWREVAGIKLKAPFPRMTYRESMERYGTDKPDTRFGLELVDVSNIVRKSDFRVFVSALEEGGVVKCINAKGCASFSRREIEELTEFVGRYGAKGLAWMKVINGRLESSIIKFFDEKTQEELVKKTRAEDGDLLLFVADSYGVVSESLGALRIELAKRLGLASEEKYNFVWIYDFPLFEWSEEEGRHVAVHHPFTSPREEDLCYLDKEPARVRARAYDLTLNGVELGGGSIRISKREVQERMFKALGIGREDAEEKFGFLLDAFEYGAPPHGGIALGLDRLVAIITKNESIREVIAFPKNKAAQSLLDGAPSDVSERQLKELHLELDLPRSGEKTKEGE